MSSTTNDPSVPNPAPDAAPPLTRRQALHPEQVSGSRSATPTAAARTPLPGRSAGFGALLHSELTKVLSVRLWWILAAIMFGYVALVSGGIAAANALPGATMTDASGAETRLLSPAIVFSMATSIGYVFPVLFGALATTVEFRHQTLTPTFLAVPRRGSALAAKILVLTVFGALYGLIALLASVGIGGAVLAITGADLALGEPDTWALIGRAVIAMALWGAIGSALGVLVPSQVASIVIVLAFTQFVEPILRFAALLVDWAAPVAQFLPGAASDALVGASVFTTMSAASTGTQLDWWQGGLVLLAYAVIAVVAGYFTSWRRDVT